VLSTLGGKTRHAPSPCLKKKMASKPVGRDASTHMQRLRFGLDRLNRVTRTGDVGVGANHFSTSIRRDMPSVFISVSFDLSSLAGNEARFGSSTTRSTLTLCYQLPLPK
jgi:hypothetical protein